jgi:hypothetical protein
MNGSSYFLTVPKANMISFYRITYDSECALFYILLYKSIGARTSEAERLQEVPAFAAAHASPAQA